VVGCGDGRRNSVLSLRTPSGRRLTTAITSPEIAYAPPPTPPSATSRTSAAPMARGSRQRCSQSTIGSRA
jgi:hypothetical protein